MKKMQSSGGCACDTAYIHIPVFKVFFFFTFQNERIIYQYFQIITDARDAIMTISSSGNKILKRCITSAEEKKPQKVL